MKRKVDETDVATGLKIVIPRKGCLEKYLMTNPQQSQQRNRRLLSMPSANQNIQFGVLGCRRARRQTILFIGMNPNPDSMGVPTPPAPIQRATYGYSTPGPSRVYRRLTFSPSPPRNIINSPPADDSTIDLSFVDTFGNMSIDSD